MLTYTWNEKMDEVTTEANTSTRWWVKTQGGRDQVDEVILSSIGLFLFIYWFSCQRVSHLSFYLYSQPAQMFCDARLMQ